MRVLWLALVLGCAADADGDGYSTRDDCDDTDAAIHPGADERCDGVDDDCDGDVDEGAVDAPTWYADADGDGHGDASIALQGCEAPAEHVREGSDCDDTRADVFPGADEVCDGVDQDCDEAIDEDPVDGTTWYADGDRDSWGQDDTAVVACQLPTEDHAERGGDCDDQDPFVHPGAEEICDNDVDDDCDGSAGECAWEGALSWTERTGAWWADGLAVHLDAGAPGLVLGDGSSAWLVTALADGGSVDEVLDDEARLTGVDGGLAVVGSDIAVGSPATGEAGAAWVHAGGLTGSTAAGVGALATLWGESVGDGAGAGLTTGDVDRDGVPELLVGATGVDGERLYLDTVENGAVYLVPGTALAGELSLGDLDAGILGTDGEVYLGAPGSFLVADLSGDDRLDAVVGGYGWEGDQGAAWVHLGTGSLWDGWRCSCEGDSELQGVEGTLVGAAVASADLDDDGYGDLVLGGPGGAGGAWVFLGSASGFGEYVSIEAADVEVLGDEAGGALATSLYADGDLDGDEVDDLVLGWPGHGGGAGAVVMLSGGALAGSLDASDLPRLEGPASGALGAAVLALSGDWSGHVVAGAPGVGAALLLDVPGW